MIEKTLYKVSIYRFDIYKRRSRGESDIFIQPTNARARCDERTDALPKRVLGVCAETFVCIIVVNQSNKLHALGCLKVVIVIIIIVGEHLL